MDYALSSERRNSTYADAVVCENPKTHTGDKKKSQHIFYKKGHPCRNSVQSSNPSGRTIHKRSSAHHNNANRRHTLSQLGTQSVALSQLPQYTRMAQNKTSQDQASMGCVQIARLITAGKIPNLESRAAELYLLLGAFRISVGPRSFYNSSLGVIDQAVPRLLSALGCSGYYFWDGVQSPKIDEADLLAIVQSYRPSSKQVVAIFDRMLQHRGFSEDTVLEWIQAYLQAVDSPYFKLSHVKDFLKEKITSFLLDVSGFGGDVYKKVALSIFRYAPSFWLDCIKHLETALRNYNHQVKPVGACFLGLTCASRGKERLRQDHKIVAHMKHLIKEFQVDLKDSAIDDIVQIVMRLPNDSLWSYTKKPEDNDLTKKILKAIISDTSYRRPFKMKVRAIAALYKIDPAYLDDALSDCALSNRILIQLLYAADMTDHPIFFERLSRFLGHVSENMCLKDVFKDLRIDFDVPFCSHFFETGDLRSQKHLTQMAAWLRETHPGDFLEAKLSIIKRLKSSGSNCWQDRKCVAVLFQLGDQDPSLLKRAFEWNFKNCRHQDTLKKIATFWGLRELDPATVQFIATCPHAHKLARLEAFQKLSEMDDTSLLDAAIQHIDSVNRKKDADAVFLVWKLRYKGEGEYFDYVLDQIKNLENVYFLSDLEKHISRSVSNKYIPDFYRHIILTENPKVSLPLRKAAGHHLSYYYWDFWKTVLADLTVQMRVRPSTEDEFDSIREKNLRAAKLILHFEYGPGTPLGYEAYVIQAVTEDVTQGPYRLYGIVHQKAKEPADLAFPVSEFNVEGQQYRAYFTEDSLTYRGYQWEDSYKEINFNILLTSLETYWEKNKKDLEELYALTNVLKSKSYVRNKLDLVEPFDESTNRMKFIAASWMQAAQTNEARLPDQLKALCFNIETCDGGDEEAIMVVAEMVKADAIEAEEAKKKAEGEKEKKLSSVTQDKVESPKYTLKEHIEETTMAVAEMAKAEVIEVDAIEAEEAEEEKLSRVKKNRVEAPKYTLKEYIDVLLTDWRIKMCLGHENLIPDVPDPDRVIKNLEKAGYPISKESGIHTCLALQAIAGDVLGLRNDAPKYDSSAGCASKFIETITKQKAVSLFTPAYAYHRIEKTLRDKVLGGYASRQKVKDEKEKEHIVLSELLMQEMKHLAGDDFCPKKNPEFFTETFKIDLFGNLRDEDDAEDDGWLYCAKDLSHHGFRELMKRLSYIKYYPVTW